MCSQKSSLRTDQYIPSRGLDMIEITVLFDILVSYCLQIAFYYSEVFPYLCIPVLQRKRLRIAFGKRICIRNTDFTLAEI